MTPVDMFAALWPYYENQSPEERPDIAFMHEMWAKQENGVVPSEQDEEHIYRLYTMSSFSGKRRV